MTCFLVVRTCFIISMFTLSSTLSVQSSIMKTPLQPYHPPSLISQSSILIVGFVSFLLAYLWPPLILLLAYLASLLIPYSFRVSDDPSVRRREFHTFIQNKELPLRLRQVPDNVTLEESYWQNSRYVHHR